MRAAAAEKEPNVAVEDFRFTTGILPAGAQRGARVARRSETGARHPVRRSVGAPKGQTVRGR
jgi:hypothetical protein